MALTIPFSLSDTYTLKWNATTEIFWFFAYPNADRSTLGDLGAAKTHHLIVHEIATTLELFAYFVSEMLATDVQIHIINGTPIEICFTAIFAIPFTIDIISTLHIEFTNSIPSLTLFAILLITLKF